MTSLKEQALDIVNAAIEQLHADGILYGSIADALGFDQNSMLQWRNRASVPSLEALEAVCALVGRSVSFKVEKVGAPRKVAKRPKNYVKQRSYDAAATRLVEFTAKELSREVGSSTKAATTWIQKMREKPGVLVQAGVRPGQGGPTIWKYAGGQSEQTKTEKVSTS